MGRLFAIGVVWLGCGVAWLILGSKILARSGELGTELTSDVHALWGPPGEQMQPSATSPEGSMRSETVTVTEANGQPSTRTIERPETIFVPAPLERSEIVVDLDLEHRRRGLLWFSTFGVDFVATYTFANPSAAG